MTEPAMTPERVAQNMKLVRALAENIERAWANVDHDESSFSEICRDELDTAALHRKLGGAELLATIALGAAIPEHLTFYPFHSAASVTGLFKAPNFSLYCHTWEEEIAFLHFHEWNGAFQSLEGESLLADYRFDERERASPKLRFGHLELSSLRRLRPGDISMVTAGPKQVHCIGHIGSRVINISVRSSVPEYTMDVYRPGLAFETSVRPSWRNHSKALVATIRADREFGIASLVNLVRDADLESAFHAMHTAFVELGGELDVLTPCNEALRARLGENFETWCASFEDLARWRLMRSIRSELSSADDLAILIAVYIASDREALEDIVEQQLGASDPATFFDDALARIFTGPGLFGVRLDAAGIGLLRGLMAGLSAERAAERAALQHGVASAVPSMTRLGRLLSENPLLRPAFARRSSFRA